MEDQVQEGLEKSFVLRDHEFSIRPLACGVLAACSIWASQGLGMLLYRVWRMAQGGLGF